MAEELHRCQSSRLVDTNSTDQRIDIGDGRDIRKAVLQSRVLASGVRELLVAGAAHRIKLADRCGGLGFDALGIRDVDLVERPPRNVEHVEAQIFLGAVGGYELDFAVLRKNRKVHSRKLPVHTRDEYVLLHDESLAFAELAS